MDAFTPLLGGSSRHASLPLGQEQIGHEPLSSYALLVPQSANTKTGTPTIQVCIRPQRTQLQPTPTATTANEQLRAMKINGTRALGSPCIGK